MNFKWLILVPWFLGIAHASEHAEALAVLEKHCLACHNAESHKGGVVLDRAPLKIDDLHLLVESTSGPKPDMPKNKPPLNEAELKALHDWARAGAPLAVGLVLHDRNRADASWWSLQSPVEPNIPAEAGNEIDYFIHAKLKEQNLSPNPPASRRDLIRRASFDLLGLPPSPERIERFVNDPDPRAFEILVDELLASPHYGERWGRHWLDVVRFCESDGFEEDMPRQDAWPYRDYVINSLNADKPYDRFVREQLAGDVLPPVTRESIVATSMLVNGPFDHAAAVSASQTEKLRAREVMLEELLTVVGQTFLGLTVNCARCHDHKFDPITQMDYYRIKSVFDGVEQAAGTKHLAQRVVLPEEKAAYQEPAARLAKLEADLKKLQQEKAEGPRQAPVKEQIANLKAELEKYPLALFGLRKEPAPTIMFDRGDIRNSGPTVAPGALSSVQQISLSLPVGAPEAERRRQFAAWVTDPKNPLTARVMVNRVWRYHFGAGFTGMPSDFGFHGGQPTHPELLDWLTLRFIQDGWSLKKLHRRILLSATWQQSSTFNSAAARVDANNRFLWRFTPQRLDGESARDALLFVSGDLNPAMGGPSFQPFTTTFFNTTFYHLFDRDEPAYNRRSIYRMNVSTGRDPLLDALDCPVPSVLTPDRRDSVTPMQALALMNDTFVIRQARKLAERSEGNLRIAWQRALGRFPTAEEEREAAQLLQETDFPTVCWMLLNSSEFLQIP